MPFDRDRPAGISSHREPRPVNKTPSGLNVQRFIAREDELHQARAYNKVNEVNAGRARWEEKQNLRSGSGARLQQKKQLEEEMDLMNKEVQVIRAERLTKYYDACYVEWEDELRARGLALTPRRIASYREDRATKDPTHGWLDHHCEHGYTWCGSHQHIGVSSCSHMHIREMKDVLALKKTSQALQLSLQLTRLVLGITSDNITEDAFRDLLLDHPQEILSQIKAIDASTVPDAAFDQICRIVEDAEYDPGLAARESEAGFFLDLDTLLTRLRRELETAHDEGRRLLPTTSFCVGVDGSRQCYVAFEVTSRLRRQGLVTVVHVDEEQSAHSIQLPVISSSFIVEEYTNHADRLRLPRNRVAVESVKHDSPSSSVASELLDTCAKIRVDFLVLGTIGKGGPAIDQLGHVPRDVLRFTPLPVLLAPPAPILSVPARSFVFVVAVDASPSSHGCLQALLKLMRPSDTVRVVHFYKKPDVGSYDESPFAFCGEFLSSVQLNGVIDVLALEPGYTIAESLHEYIAKYHASYLVLGLNGERHASEAVDGQRGHSDILENPIGRVTAAMLFSPRCTLCICP